MDGMKRVLLALWSGFPAGQQGKGQIAVEGCSSAKWAQAPARRGDDFPVSLRAAS